MHLLLLLFAIWVDLYLLIQYQQKMFAKTSLSQFKLSNNQKKSRLFNTSLTSFNISKSQPKNNQKFGKFQIEKLDLTNAFHKQSFLPPHSLRSKKNNNLPLPNFTFTQAQFSKHSNQGFMQQEDNPIEQMKKFSPLLSSKRRAAKCKIQTKAKMAFKQLVKKQQQSKNKFIEQSQVQQLNGLLQNTQRRKAQKEKQPYLDKERFTQQFGAKNNNSINTNIINQLVDPTQKPFFNILEKANSSDKPQKNIQNKKMKTQQKLGLLQMLKKSQQQRKKLQQNQKLQKKINQIQSRDKRDTIVQGELKQSSQTSVKQKNQSQSTVEQILKKNKKELQQRANFAELLQKQQKYVNNEKKESSTLLDSSKGLKSVNQIKNPIQKKAQLQKQVNLNKRQVQSNKKYSVDKKNSFNLQSVQQLKSVNTQRKSSTNNNLDKKAQEKVQQQFPSQKQTNLPKESKNTNKNNQKKQEKQSFKGNTSNNANIKQAKPINTRCQQNGDLQQIDFDNNKKPTDQLKNNSKKEILNQNKNIKEEQLNNKNIKQEKNSNKNIKQEKPIIKSLKQQLPNKNNKDQNNKTSTGSQQISKGSANVKKQKEENNRQEQANQSRQQFQQDEDQIMEQIYFYFDRNQELCNFTKESKDFYLNADSSMIQLVMNNKLLTYYAAHQFYYYTNKFLEIFNQKKIFYTVTAEEVKEALQDEAFQQQVQQLKVNLQKTKKLIMSCFKNCKMYLKKNQQELVIQVKNYHQKCLQYLKKQFKGVYQIYTKNNTNRSAARRCSYLIQMWSTLNLLNKRELKQHEDIQDIQDFDLHIKTNKHLILASQ